MIAGFIFLRLRGILGKKTGFEENINSSFPHEEVPETKTSPILNADTFDDAAKKDFLNGAKIAYESIITSFSKGDLSLTKQSKTKKQEMSLLILRLSVLIRQKSKSIIKIKICLK